MEKIKAILISIFSVLIPYIVFALSLFLLFRLNTGMFYTEVKFKDALVVFSVFSMMFLFLGSAALSPLDISVGIIADITTSSGSFELADFGDGNYSVLNRGDAGAGVLILKLLINIVLTPFMIIFWIIAVIAFCISRNVAEKYLERVEAGRIVLSNLFTIISIVLVSIETNLVNARVNEATSTYDNLIFSLKSIDYVETSTSYNYSTNETEYIYEYFDIKISVTGICENVESFNLSLAEGYFGNTVLRVAEVKSLKFGKDTFEFDRSNKIISFQMTNCVYAYFYEYNSNISLKDVNVDNLRLVFELKQINFSKIINYYQKEKVLSTN